MPLEHALDLGREAFLMALTMSVPILVVGLLVRLSIPLFQVILQQLLVVHRFLGILVEQVGDDQLEELL